MKFYMMWLEVLTQLAYFVNIFTAWYYRIPFY